MAPTKGKKEILNHGSEFIIALGADIAFRLDEGRDYDLFLTLIENSSGIQEEPFGILKIKMEGIKTNDEIREVFEKAVGQENVEELLMKLVKMKKMQQSNLWEPHDLLISTLRDIRYVAAEEITDLRSKEQYKKAAEMALIWILQTNLI